MRDGGGPFPLWKYRGSEPPLSAASISVHVSRGRLSVSVYLDGAIDTAPPANTLGPEVAETVPLAERPISLRLCDSGVPGLAASLDLWGADMLRRGKKSTTVRQFRDYVLRCARACGWQDIHALNLAQAAEWLSERRADSWSPSTHDIAVSALHGFSKFLHRRGDLKEDVLAFLDRAGGESGDGSRALTTDEARRLIRSTLAVQRATRKTKANRVAWYAVLLLTGLRTAEAGGKDRKPETPRLKWKDIDLDAAELWTDPAWAKNGRRQRIVLNVEIVLILRWHREMVPHAPGDPVFPKVPNRHVWHQDRERAGIPMEDGRGRPATPHSCRKFLATALDAAGASPGVASRIIRHAIGLTQRVYIDPNVAEERRACELLPQLWPVEHRNLIETARENLTDGGVMPDTRDAETPVMQNTLPNSMPQTARHADHGSESQQPTSTTVGRAFSAIEPSIPAAEPASSRDSVRQWAIACPNGPRAEWGPDDDALLRALTRAAERRWGT